jgi:hypothetical protein
MSVLVWGVIFFILAFFLHILIWRVRKPANPIKTLILLFSCSLLFGIVLLTLFSNFYPDVLWLPSGVIQYLYIVILFFSLFFSYLLTYPGIEADSPSLVIALKIAETGKSGFPVEKLKCLLGDNILVLPRLKDLVDAGLVNLEKGRYIISKKGALFIFPFVAFRNFLGLSKGG